MLCTFIWFCPAANVGLVSFVKGLKTSSRGLEATCTCSPVVAFPGEASLMSAVPRLPEMNFESEGMGVRVSGAAIMAASRVT
jgi:hypothetical protein